MNIFTKIKFKLEHKIGNIIHYFKVKKYKRLYPDYEDNEYNIDELRFIWGITSWDNLTGMEANFYTMNDIDITYDRKSKKYMLSIETAYMFKDREAECKYLRKLLNYFTKFIEYNNYPKSDGFMLFMNEPSLTTEADTIEELYTNFRIFVEGFCKIYG